MIARLSALALGFLGLAALRGQFDLLLLNGLGPKLWQLAGFFTILTNALLVVHLLAIAKDWKIPASRAAGLLLSILMVGAVYHLVLAGLWAPQGRAWWVDQGLHSAMPLGYLLWWLAFAPKTLRWSDLPTWLLWPAAYAAYALTRGALTGFWAYPFLNADALGWPRVALICAGLLLAFTALGAAILTLARRLQARPS
jgi:hypothetical protein